MRILFTTNQAPFVWGGAEYLAESLKEKVQAQGHEMEIVRIPFKWYPPECITHHIVACRLLRINILPTDLVIGNKFPAYLVPFERKKLWLSHQFRQVYELWGTPFQDLPNTPEGRRVREMIMRADTTYLREVKEIYTVSRTVADRLKRFNGIEATAVLYPPLRNPELFHKGDIGDYFFFPSRINPGKRQIVAIEAMRYVRSRFRLILAGLADNPAYSEQLKGLIEQYGLQERVQMLGWVSEQEKADLMANAFAALYLPYQEDSYGYVTLEAFHSHKPVIVFTDSGGTDELVVDQENGLVVEPSPQALASAMEELWFDRLKTAQMGDNAANTLAQKQIDWDHVLDRLLS